MTGPDGERRSRVLAPLTTGVAVVGAVLVLHLLGDGALAAPPASLEELPAWLDEREPGAVAAVAVRLTALAVGYHLIATSAALAAGRILRRPGLVQVAETATLPPFRGTVRRLAGLGLSASAALVTPFAASADPAPGTATLTVVDPAPPAPPSQATLERLDGTAPPSSVGPSTTTSTPSPPSTTSTVADEPPTSDPPASSDAPPTSDAPPPATPAAPVVAGAGRVVGPGDHLWAIAEDGLITAWGRPATDAEVASYWRAVVAANPQVLDPDLLFVGEQIRVPPPPPAPPAR